MWRGGAARVSAAPSSPTEAERCERRIRKELHRLWIDPPSFCRPGSSPVTDLLRWEVVIDGPEGSPYAGGTFPVEVQFTGHHPFKPPKITFKTKVYHPNIDSEGQMVLDIFQGNWSPALTVEKLLLSIVSVLYDPMLDHPVDRHIARLYKSNIELYEEKARAWTRRYASTPVVSYYPAKGDGNWEDYCAAIADHREAERLRAAAASLAHQKLVSSRRRENSVSLLWRRTVALLHGRPVAAPSAIVAAAAN